MNVGEFFVRWFRGVRSFSGSALGSAQFSFIVNCFIVFGLFLGSWQQKLIGNGVMAFILFCFGLLTLWGLPRLWKQFVVLSNQEKLRRRMIKNGF